MRDIKLRGTVYQEVHVDVSVVLDQAIELFRKYYQIHDVDGIESGKMYEHVEYHTSHSWTSKENRGAPTTQQADALKAVDMLRVMMKDRNVS